MKKLLLGLIAAIICITSNAQSLGYSSDAVAIAESGNTVTIRSSGVHEKRKMAEITAIKSAFYAYLTTGIQGLNGDRPLIDEKLQSDPKVMAMINYIVENQYNIYVKSYIADQRVTKSLGKMFKVSVTFEMYNEAFIKFLVSNGITAKADDKITLRESDDNMIMPTIMIVPRVKDGETIKEVLDSSPEYRATISKLAQALLKEGVQTKNFDEVYDGVVMAAALASGSASSDDKILSEASKGVDVVAYMDIKETTNDRGTSVELTLTATNAATRSTIAALSDASGFFRNQSVSHLSGLLAEAIAPEFVKQVATSFGTMQRKGQGISIRIELDSSSSADFNTEVGTEGFTVGDIMRLWIKKSAKSGRYRLATQTSSLLIYDQIFIPTQDEGGNFSDVNDFELELRMHLRENGVTIAKRLLDGNNIIYTLML